MARIVPGIAKWDVSAGGTGAAPGKRGYGVNAGGVRYTISPFSHPSGRHAGYILTVSPGRRGLHAWVAFDGREHSFPARVA